MKGGLRMKKINTFIISFFFVSIVIVSLTIGVFKSNEAKAHEEHHNDTKFADSYLLTKNRDSLTICIENYSEQFPGEELSGGQLTNNALFEVENSLSKHARWEAQGLDKVDINFVSGCSFKPLLLEPGKNHVFFSGDIDSIRTVENASKERLGIFIVDNDVINKHFNDAPLRMAPEEFICEKNECNEVTTGVYLTADEYQNIRLTQELSYALGLDVFIPGDKTQKNN